MHYCKQPTYDKKHEKAKKDWYKKQNTSNAVAKSGKCKVIKPAQ